MQTVVALALRAWASVVSKLIFISTSFLYLSYMMPTLGERGLLQYAMAACIPTVQVEIISDYFVQKADAEMNKMCENGTLNEERIESFRHLHERTPYNKPVSGEL